MTRDSAFESRAGDSESDRESRTGRAQEAPSLPRRALASESPLVSGRTVTVTATLALTRLLDTASEKRPVGA